jgi:8-oxo-dGTP pyrophosphatase MutT (NUDIX family)
MQRAWWFAAVRPQGKPAGTWALPKGLVGPGERSLEAAVREGEEETGIRAHAVSRIGDVRYVYTWEGERVFKIVSFFLARATGGRIGEIPPEMEVEIAEVRWLRLADAGRLLTYRGERETAAKALELLSPSSNPRDFGPTGRGSAEHL